MAAKYAILKALVENQIVELMFKTDVTNIYLEDGETTLASKLATMLTDIGNKANSTDVTAEIKAAIDALIDGAPGTYDTLKEIADYLSTHKDEYTALVETIGSKASTEALNAVIDRVGALETKMGTIAEGAQVNVLEGVQLNGVDLEITGKKVNVIVPTGAMADKDSVSEADLDDALKEKVNSAAAGNHSHANKDELDKIADGDKAKWDAAAEKAHEHENATVLDGITAEKVTAWDGKSNVYVQSSQPTDLKAGDLWVQVL